MKKIVLIILSGLLLIGVNAFAADGDFIIEGKVGIGTNTPSKALTIVGGPGDGLRIVDSSTNVKTQFDTNQAGDGRVRLWDSTDTELIRVVAGGTGYFKRTRVTMYDNSDKNIFDVNPDTREVVVNEDSENIDFRVESNTGTHALFVRGLSGRVGIGTSTPRNTIGWPASLDVNGEVGAARYYDDDRNYYIDANTQSYFFDLYVTNKLILRGQELNADYVFSSDYNLESIEDHSNFMWANKHLKAIPGVRYDEAGREILEIGAHNKGIVEELEKAHIYIDQLNERIKKMEEKLAKLEDNK